MRITKILTATLVTVAFSGQAVFADPKFEIEPVGPFGLEGSLVHNPSAIKWDRETDDGGRMSATIEEADGVPGGQAIQIKVKKKTAEKPWNVRLRASVRDDITINETIEVYFWARATKFSKGRDSGKVGVMMGRNEEPYDTIVNQDILPTKEWKMYKISGVSQADFPADQTEMGFNMGAMKQTLQFGPFYAVTRGTDAE